MTDEEPSKICAKCKVLKSVAEFGKNNHMKDRLQSACKVCQKEYERSCKEKWISDPIIEASAKVCTVCKCLKDNSEFSKGRNKKDGLQNRCKACAKEYREDNKYKISAQRKAYRAEHGEELSARSKLFYAEHRDTIIVRRRARDEGNKDELLAYRKAYYELHKEQLNADRKAYSESHREDERARNKRYSIAHKDDILSRRRVYRERNSDKIAITARQWQINNPDKANANAANYRSRKLNATPSWFEKEDVLELYMEAASRSKNEGVDYHVDHIVPLQSKFVCGLHCLANLEIITAIENRRKHNLYWPGQDWIIHS
jgi:hypothetical protein